MRANRIARGARELSQPYESYAQQLVELGPEVLGAGRAESRRIGERLHVDGGFDLMLQVANRAETLSMTTRGVSMLRELDMSWNLIGDWRG